MSEAAVTPFIEIIRKAILPIRKLYPYRFWKIKGEVARPILEQANQQRLHQEKKILADWINGMDMEVRRMVLCKLEDAEKNERILNMAISAKISCAKKLLENQLPIAASILMEQVTGWHADRRKALPSKVLEIAMLTAKVQAKENDLPEKSSDTQD